jgi:hypothetical protein
MCRSQTLEGDNAYACEQCNCKTTAKKMDVLSVAPEILVIRIERIVMCVPKKQAKSLRPSCKSALLVSCGPQSLSEMTPPRSDGDVTTVSTESVRIDPVITVKVVPESAPAAKRPRGRSIKGGDDSRHPTAGPSPPTEEKYALYGVILRKGGSAGACYTLFCSYLPADMYGIAIEKHNLTRSVLHRADLGHYFAVVNSSAKSEGPWFVLNDERVEQFRAPACTGRGALRVASADEDMAKHATHVFYKRVAQSRAGSQ